MSPSREACDRCHSMKTKCVRSLQSNACHRCRQAKQACVYSPTKTVTRPRDKAGKNAKSREDVDVAQQSQSDDIISATPPQFYIDEMFLSDITSFDNTSFLGLQPNSYEGPFSFPLDEPIRTNFTTSQNSLDASLFGSTSSLPAPNQTLHEIGEIPSTSSSPSCSSASIEPSQKGHCLLDDLSVVYSKLVALGRQIHNSSSGLSHLEEIYELSEKFMVILDRLQKPLRIPKTILAKSYQGSAIFTISSCYYNFLHVYDLTSALLRQEKLQRGLSPDVQSGLVTSVPRRGGSPQTDVPSISVGGVRLPMSRAAAAEINLHLILQSARQLRRCMGGCISRLANTWSKPTTDTGGTGHEFVTATGNQSDALLSLVLSALSEMRVREDDLIAHV